MNKKVGCLGGGALVLVLLLGLVLATRSIWGKQMQRAVLTVVSNDPMLAKLTDGKLHVFTLGTGNPSPRSERVQTATAVMAGGNFLLIDAGTGSAWRSQQLGWPMQELDVILLTHLHSDHVSDVGAMSATSWRAGRDSALPIIGPEGTEKMAAGFRDAFEGDYNIRYSSATQVEGFATLPLDMVHDGGQDVTIKEADACRPVYAGENGLTVCAFLVDHHGDVYDQAFGYRVDYGGRSVVISGDTRPSQNLAKQAAGADLLIHEAYNAQSVADMLEIADANFADDPNVQFFVDTIVVSNQEHTSALEAAQIAQQAGVDTLVYNHLPTFGPKLLAVIYGKPSFLNGVADVFDGKAVIAEDGTEFVFEPQQ